MLFQITKNNSSVVCQFFWFYRKAVRAAVVLLPLLGITNVLFMIEAPLHNVKKFALWSYSTHFLQSFQGLFIATLYCFLNGEVKQLISKKKKENLLKFPCSRVLDPIKVWYTIECYIQLKILHSEFFLFASPINNQIDG